MGKLASSIHLVDSITQSIWTYAWGLHGLEKATKTVNGQTALTQDFTTDPNGTILSMTYSTPGEGYDGELYFHYDHLGNTTLLTNTDGDPVASFQYDLHSGKIVNEWNENNLEVINLNEGREGGIKCDISSLIRVLISFSGLITILNSIYSTVFTNTLNFLSYGLASFSSSVFSNSSSTETIVYGKAHDCKCKNRKIDGDSVKKALQTVANNSGWVISEDVLNDAVTGANKKFKDCCKSKKNGGQGGSWFEVVVYEDSEHNKGGYHLRCRDANGNIIKEYV